tara:strand:- start:8308 stop:8634 length:327 start_codon:yes stop_codon:yes gene_type:complete
MALKRVLGNKPNPYCNVVDQLVTLEELGFKEDNYRSWVYIIYESNHNGCHYSKSILASGDYLYLRDQSGNKVTDIHLTTLWNSNKGGFIKKHQIEQFINLLKLGNVRE